jgi:hypothetical protein
MLSWAIGSVIQCAEELRETFGGLRGTHGYGELAEAAPFGAGDG